MHDATIVLRPIDSNQKKTSLEDRLITEKEVARLLSLGVSTIQQDRLTGRLGLPFVRLGRSVRYRLSEIENFLRNIPSFTSTSGVDVGKE